MVVTVLEPGDDDDDGDASLEEGEEGPTRNGFMGSCLGPSCNRTHRTGMCLVSELLRSCSTCSTPEPEPGYHGESVMIIPSIRMQISMLFIYLSDIHIGLFKPECPIIPNHQLTTHE